MNRILSTALLAAVALLGSGVYGLTDPSASSPMAAGESAAGSSALYTAYTLWYENPKKMSSVNYHIGTIIPVGSEVIGVSIRGRNIRFQLAGGGGAFSIQFIRKFHPGVSIQEFKNRLFVSEPLEERIKGFSEEEQTLIRKGVVEKGMSKEAVLVSWGNPPDHQTPSTTANTWFYWRSRFVKETVDFDPNGKVMNVR